MLVDEKQKEIWLDEHCIPVCSQVKSLLISSSCGAPFENCLSQLHYFQPPIFSKYEQWLSCVQLHWDPPKESGETLIPVASACINHIYPLYPIFFYYFLCFSPQMEPLLHNGSFNSSCRLDSLRCALDKKLLLLSLLLLALLLIPVYITTFLMSLLLLI